MNYKMVKSIIRDIPDDKFIDIIKNSKNWSNAMRNCGCNNVGNYSTLKKRIEELKLDISHFDRNNYDRSNRKIPNNEVFIKNSKFSGRQRMKEKLFLDFDWIYKCNSCSISEWKNRKGELMKISLELEHINGINNDNRNEMHHILKSICVLNECITVIRFPLEDIIQNS